MSKLSSARIELEAREAIGSQCFRDLELGVYDFSVLEQMMAQRGVSVLVQEPKIPWHRLSNRLSSLREFSLIAKKALALYQEVVIEKRSLSVPEQRASIH